MNYASTMTPHTSRNFQRYVERVTIAYDHLERLVRKGIIKFSPRSDQIYHCYIWLVLFIHINTVAEHCRCQESMGWTGSSSNLNFAPLPLILRMGAVKWITILLKYPLEINFKILIQFCLYYLKRRNSAWKEHPSSGWDRQTMKRCWELLDMMDKPWCMLAKQLDGDLPRVVSYTQFTASNFGVVIPSIYFVLLLAISGVASHSHLFVFA